MNTLNPSDAFIFNKNNQGFLTGQSHQYEGKSAFYRTIRWLFMTVVFIGLPAIIILGVLNSLIFQLDFFDQLLQNIAILFIVFGIIAFIRYSRNIRINRDGILLIGSVIRYTTRMGYSLKGYKQAQLLHYELVTPTGKIVSGVSFVSNSPTQLPDGRSLPKQGTKIGILYVTDAIHIVL